MQTSKNKDETTTLLLVNKRTKRRIWSKYQKQDYYKPEPLKYRQKPKTKLFQHTLFLRMVITK